MSSDSRCCGYFVPCDPRCRGRFVPCDPWRRGRFVSCRYRAGEDIAGAQRRATADYDDNDNFGRHHPGLPRSNNVSGSIAAAVAAAPASRFFLHVLDSNFERACRDEAQSVAVAAQCSCTAAVLVELVSFIIRTIPTADISMSAATRPGPKLRTPILRKSLLFRSASGKR